MKKICANFKITTPMFLGAADNENTAELKATSIKGALRFWFRAIEYGKYENYKELKVFEDALFGSTGSQGVFFLKLKTENVNVEDKELKINALLKDEYAYLGYGLFQKSRNFYRPYLIPGGTFSLELLFNPRYSKNVLCYENVFKSIEALGLFGGLGSRSRRGFGSITLISISVDGRQEWNAPKSREELKSIIEDFYSGLELGSNMPEHTAFSDKTKTVILSEYDSYKEALANVGKAMMNFRQNCNNDTDIVKNYLRGITINEHPERVVFGLPHNYFFRKQGAIDINAFMDKEIIRRASPLFIKIISIKENDDIKYIPVMTVFPSDFLPENSKILFKNRNNGRETEVEPKVSFKLIKDFMETFPNRLEVIPLG